MQEVIYNGDRRYPAPRAHPPPESIDGIPTQAELDAYPRMFTWGELKGIIQSGDLELLMRNKALQARYDTWMVGMKVKYGSTENYLTTARLPWKRTKEAIGTYDPSSLESGGPEISLGRLTESTLPRSGNESIKVEEMSTTATPGERAQGGGADTPSSAGFVSLASLRLVNGKLRRMAGASGASESGTSTPYDPVQSPSPDDEEAEQQGHEEPAVYLRWDSTTLDSEKYAVLPNDWPYNIPYGVRHYCVWSKVPIAHPELVDYNPDSWSKIEKEGLGGFSGITPLHPFKIQTPPSPNDPNANPSQILFTHDSAGRQKFIGQLPDKDWYAADVAYSGLEMGSWAGKEYESVGGKEVGKMVRGLWDPRGWECLWFVNPPRLQSVPGFSHFHVFARRKTPEEIDASEAYWTGEV